MNISLGCYQTNLNSVTRKSELRVAHRQENIFKIIIYILSFSILEYKKQLQHIKAGKGKKLDIKIIENKSLL